MLIHTVAKILKSYDAESKSNARACWKSKATFRDKKENQHKVNLDTKNC